VGAQSGVEDVSTSAGQFADKASPKLLH